MGRRHGRGRFTMASERDDIGSCAAAGTAPVPAKLLRLHLSERDRYRGKPLYEAIVDKCRELHIAGATVFRGVEGYGASAELHKSHFLTHDLPIMITVVDSAENITRLLPVVQEMMSTALIAMNDVQVTRIQRSHRTTG
jgi:PII-like signaling protein